jgi:pilus assembly protein CpaE
MNVASPRPAGSQQAEMSHAETPHPDDNTATPLGRHDRPQFIGFVTDAASEAALRDGLADVLAETADIRRGGIRAAVTALAKITTPRILVVDVSGEDEPLASLGALSEVVEPDVCVLVVGDFDDITFYREVTRGLGAMEYVAKPLTRDLVARHFGPVVRGSSPAASVMLGGRVVAVTGAQGGVGTSVIAANLAWHIGVVRRRHTVLIDADLYRGTAAFLLNTAPGPGLKNALETPERIDTLLAERAAQPAGERLHVLASLENLTNPPVYAPRAAETLMDALRRRYNFIVADTPFNGQPFSMDLLGLSHQRVIVMLPTLVSIRDALRLLALPPGPLQVQRAVLVLNRVGMTGGLQRRQVEEALGVKVDVVIPDLPRLVATSATLGEPAAAARGGFRNAIVELARQVASQGLHDPTGRSGGDEVPAPRRGWWSFGRR